jgi:Big-like domain-containing protein
MRRLHVVVALLLAALLQGCSSSSSQSNPKTLQSVAVTPAQPSVALGVQQQFKATGMYSDGTSQDLTSTAVWTSSQTAVATIIPGGLATTKATGTSSITATSPGGISGSTTLTVTAAALSSIAVTPANPSVPIGVTEQFTATGTFSDGSTQNLTSSVTWSAVANNIARITTAGLAKGLAAGTATITATSGSISGSTNLTVTNATLASIAITPASPTVPLGLLQQFTATGTYSDGSTADLTNSVTWASSIGGVASINVTGQATARNLGSTQISATSGTVHDSTTLTVSAASLNSISLGGDVTVAANTSHPFTAIGTFNDGSTRNISNNVSWSSSDTTVATIPASYPVAKGIQVGTSEIKATLNSISGTANLTVTSATIQSISVSPADLSVAPGVKLRYFATGRFSDSSSQDLSLDAVWSSNAPAVASIASPGNAQALTAGPATITAAFGGMTGTTSLTVTSATLTTITVKPATASMAPASSLGFSATGTFSDGSTQPLSNVATWTSTDTTVATVDAIGEVTAASAGSSTITATFNSVPGTASVIVQSSPLQSIVITPSPANVPEGMTIPLVATGKFADGTTQNLSSNVTWTCTPSSIATVSNVPSFQGIVTGVAPGAATVTAVFGGIVGTSTVNTTNATLISIVVTPSNPGIGLTETEQFAATGHFSDGSSLNLTRQVTWSSTDVTVAVINSSGIATPVATGSTTITATLNGMNGTTVLTVH